MAAGWQPCPSQLLSLRFGKVVATQQATAAVPPNRPPSLPAPCVLALACWLAWFTESGPRLPGPDRLLPLAPSQRGRACALQEVMARLNQIFSARKITFGSKVCSCEGAGMFCHVVG